MLSRITIDIDFSNSNRPVIRIFQKPSDDVRDSLVNNFINHLDHTSVSRWVRLEHLGEVNGGLSWQLVPITTDELKKEAELIEAVLSSNDTVPV